MEHAELGVHRRGPELLGVHLAESLVALHADACGAAHLHDGLLQLLIGPGVDLLLALLGAVEWRERDVDVARLEQRPEVAVDEREQERPDVGSVHVGVRHEDDLVVAELLVGELVGPGGDLDTQRGDHVLDLLVVEDLVEAGLLDVQDLAAQRQDGLEVAVARLLRRAAGGVALHQVELRLARVLRRAVGQLAGQAAAAERRLALDELARTPRRRPRLRAQDHLLHDRLGLAGVVLQPLAELLSDEALDGALDLAVAQLGLGLALELRLLDLDAQDGREAFPEVVAGEVDLGLLEELVLVGVALERPRQRAAEAGHVRAALVRVDVVDERQDVLLVARVVTHRQLHGHVGVLVLDVDLAVEERLARLVEIGHELGQAALRVVRLGAQRLVVLALVGEGDRDALVEVRQFTHARGQRVEAVDAVEEDARVRLEADRRAGLLALGHVADAGQLLDRVALLEGHLEDAPVAAHLDVEAVRERVDATHADAVEAARHLVGVLVELAACVQDRHHHLDGGLALGGVHGHGDATAVVRHRDRVVLVDDDLDVVAVARERLVDRVVHDLVHEVVQPADADIADVHGRALADRLQAFEHLDVARAVIAPRGRAIPDGRWNGECVGGRRRRLAVGCGGVLVRAVGSGHRAGESGSGRWPDLSQRQSAQNTAGRASQP